MKRIKVIISGEVQGVFFRSFIRQNALERGVNGYVRNRTDGKLEAVFEGKDKDVSRFAQRLESGACLLWRKAFKGLPKNYSREHSRLAPFRQEGRTGSGG